MTFNLHKVLPLSLLTLVSAVLGGVIGAWLVDSRPKSDVRVRQLELVDANGRTRGSFRINQRGGPVLDLLDENGDSVAALGAEQDLSYLRFHGNDAWSALDLQMNDGKPILAFSGDERQGRVLVGYMADDDTVPSTLGHWGMRVSSGGQETGKALAFGSEMSMGRDFDLFASFPDKHPSRYPVSPGKMSK